MLQKSTKAPKALLGESAQSRECLLVMLQPQLVLAKIRPWPLVGFTCEGKQYRDVGLGEWTEFYDWLRDSNGNILGVRYWLGSETEFLADNAKELPYVQIDPSRHLEIYFPDRREVNPSLSGDQEFLYDAIFGSDDHQYAIGFGLELGPREIVSLQNAGATGAKAARLS